MKEIIIGCIFILISAAAFIISTFSFKEKGYLFNNVYIYASKQERERMDKKPYYRQSAIAFLLVGIILFLIGIAMLLHTAWIIFIAMAAAVIALVYVITSSIAIKKQKR